VEVRRKKNISLGFTLFSDLEKNPRNLNEFIRGRNTKEKRDLMKLKYKLHIREY